MYLRTIIYCCVPSWSQFKQFLRIQYRYNFRLALHSFCSLTLPFLLGNFKSGIVTQRILIYL